MDRLQSMRVFQQVVDDGSFAAAARKFDMSPAVVTRLVGDLEDHLGVRLLQRTTRSVGLTEAGERLYASVAPAFTQIRSAVESLNELRERPAGTVRLTLAHAAGPYLYDQLKDFMEQYPEVRLDLSFEDGLIDIAAIGFDAGVRLGEVLDQEMIAIDLSGPQRMAVVGSPAYFGKHPKPKHPRDLLQHDCVGHRRANGTIYNWEFDENGKDFEIAVPSRIITNDMAHTLRLALDGVALAVLFEDHVRPELQSGQLVRVLKEYCSPFPGFYLYYPNRAHTPLKLRALADFLRKRKRRVK